MSDKSCEKTLENNYNYDFLCTYQHIENSEESNICYQMQFLQAFGINQYDSDVIEHITDFLYNQLKHDDGFIELIKKIKAKMGKRLNFVGFLNGTEESNLTDSDIFCFIFSYDYFYKFHREYSLYKNNKNYNFDFII